MKWRCIAGSNKEEIQKIRQATMEVLHSWGIKSGGLLFEFNVILCELLANAGEHGNRWEPDKKVSLNLRYYPEHETIFILVCDEGSNPFTSEICTEQLSERGRGLAMIKSLTDRCQIGCGRVWIRKKVVHAEEDSDC